MSKVELEPCGPERRAMLDALLQLYTHDFSEFWAGTDRGELTEAGRFPDYPHLDLYWAEPDRSAWLIRADGHPAGMALLNRHSHAGLPTDHAMAEFFVVRKHRRCGVGREAARRLIAQRPGQWELAVARANVAAFSFWLGLAEGLATELEVMDREDADWNGPILRFRIAAA